MIYSKPISVLALISVLTAGLTPSASAAGLSKAKEWNRDRAAHLLRRAGFGGSIEDVDRLFSLGLEKAVDSLIDYEKVAQTHSDFQLPELSEPLALKNKLEGLPEAERRDVRQQLRSLNNAQLEELRAWWVERMLLTPRPFEEKMTLFWHGYFATGAEEVKVTRLMAEQNATLRSKATGDYRELLLAICKDRAMLRYLNGDTNTKEKPNENFARELLELFTLGTGNYTEKDIKEAARAFTGWTVDHDGFRFRPRQHDFDEKTFLGRTGEFDGDDIIGIILEQPAASRHLAIRLLKFFMSDEPDKNLVDAFAAKLRESRYNIRESLRALFKSEAFYRGEVMFAHIKSPPELVIGTARALGITKADCFALANGMRTMGQDLFQPPNVKGWDGGRTWVNSATLFTRYDFSGLLLSGTPQQMFERREKKLEELKQIRADFRSVVGKDVVPFEDELQVASYRQPAFDPRNLLQKQVRWTKGEVLDRLLLLLLQRDLSADQRAELAQRLGPLGEEFDITHADSIRQLNSLIYDIMLLPEFQLS